MGKGGGKGGRQRHNCLLNPMVLTTVLNSEKMPPFTKRVLKLRRVPARKVLTVLLNKTLAFFLGKMKLKMNRVLLNEFFWSAGPPRGSHSGGRPCSYCDMRDDATVFEHNNLKKKPRCASSDRKSHQAGHCCGPRRHMGMSWTQRNQKLDTTAST